MDVSNAAIGRSAANTILAPAMLRHIKAIKNTLILNIVTHTILSEITSYHIIITYFYTII